MNRIMRLSSLAVALVVTIALLATTAPPVQAQTQTHVSAAARSAHPEATVSGEQGARGAALATRSTKAQAWSTSTPWAGDHVKPFGHHINFMGHDYCGGWIHGPAWCLTFNRSEAGYISAVSLSVAAAFICAGTALITCGAAVGIAAAIQRYVDHHGVCPSSHPKMRVEYFPHPGTVSCD